MAGCVSHFLLPNLKYFLILRTIVRTLFCCFWPDIRIESYGISHVLIERPWMNCISLDLYACVCVCVQVHVIFPIGKGELFGREKNIQSFVFSGHVSWLIFHCLQWEFQISLPLGNNCSRNNGTAAGIQVWVFLTNVFLAPLLSFCSLPPFSCLPSQCLSKLEQQSLLL